MATKKPELKTFSVTGTFSNLQVSVEVQAADLTSAVEKAKTLKITDFVTEKGDIYDFEGPEITSIWKN